MNRQNRTSALHTCLWAVWRRGQRKDLASGLLAAGCWAVILALAAVALDWLTDLPAWVRGLAAVILIAVAAERGWRFGWQRLRRFRPAALAAEIEQRQGGLESLLVTAEQFSRCGPTPGTSTTMWELTQRQAEEAAGRLEPAALVTFRDLRRPLVVAGVVAAIVAGCAVVNGPLLAAGATRLFAPWRAVAYPTKTRIDLDQGDLVVKEGDRASIVARLSGVIPDQATVLLQTGVGRPREMAVDVIDGRCEYLLASAARDFSYRVKAGDARTGWHRVRVVSAPRIENVDVRLDYPDYLDRPSESVESLTLTVPENTTVHWQLSLDRPVREATLHRDGEDPRSLTVSEDGRQVVLDDVATASRGYVFDWVEREHGFGFTSPRSYLTVAADQPPRIELSSPAENLNALIGRRLQLAVRASDDHGLGPATITCRVNQRPEKVIPLALAIHNNSGEQPLDWDYRDALPDLEEGDTVSFVVEVADRYPGPDGPHRARTEARRITFLSRADYLAEIRKRMDRILAHVRTIYRQERAAHEFVRGLDPRSASFAPSSQLEAVRQEMIREQLQETAGKVRALLDDLAANEVADAIEGESLASLAAEVQSIATDEVAAAAALLRDQATAAAAGSAEAAPAVGKVNAAARRLAALVLLRGLDAAREVFARESQMLAEEQAQLRVRGLGNATGESLATHQEDVITWIGQLLSQLESGLRRDERPLATLALSRRIHDLRGSGAESGMREAAGMLRAGKLAEAATLQAETIPPLLAAEFSVRTGAEYASLLRFREVLDALFADQQRLLRESEAETSPPVASLAARQERLVERLTLALLPAIPPARSRLLDEVLPAVPPAAELRSAAEMAMKEALRSLRSGTREAAVPHQGMALETLAEIRALVARRVTELGTMTQGLSTLVSTASDRALRFEEFEARQIGLLEQTEEAALDEKSPAALAEPQQFLTTELTRFRRDIAGPDEAGMAKDTVPLVGRIDRAAAVMAAAEKALAAGDAEKALPLQEKAADKLAEARQVSEAQRAKLALLQELLAFREAVGFAATSIGDIIAEQRDLVTAATDADETACEQLLPRARNLGACLVEIAPVLDLVAGRVDAGTPLLFVGSDVEDAIAALEDGDGQDAAEILNEASESLATVQRLVAAVQTQTGYVAEIVEYLYDAEAEAADFVFRQGQIRERLLSLDAVPAEVVAEQETLRAEVEAFGRRLERVTGSGAFSGAAGMLADAVGPLRAGRVADAAGCMESAESTLLEQAAELSLMITVLHGLPAIQVSSVSSEELQRLVDVLAVAAEQRRISRRTRGDATNLSDVSIAEQALAQQAAAIPPGPEPHPLLLAAFGRLAAAARSLQASALADATGHQRAADDMLRHYVIEQAVLLNTAIPPPSGSDEPVLTENETDDLYESTANIVSDFVSGETPKDKRTEWEVLGARNRAALNQNFARELPLEYRATLKNYYERVAK